MTGDLNIAGLDPSTKRIGFSAPSGACYSIESDKLPAHPSPMHLAKRCNLLKNRLARVIVLNPPIPDLVIIEGGFSHYPGPSARLDELRGVLRDLLYAWPMPHGEIEFVEIPPKSLKLFATGKSTADKTLMMHTAASRIRALDPAGRVPKNDDEADAWHLRRFGRVAHGLEESLTQYELDAIAECGAAF